MEGKTVVINRDTQEKIYLRSSSSSYNLVRNFKEDVAFSTVEGLVKIVKEKGLTTRQAQQVFEICTDYILDHTFN